MESGDIYRNGEYICTIRPNGDIYHNGEYLGTVRDNGDIFHNGEYLGNFDGGDFRKNGTYLGTMTSNGDFMRNGEYLGTFYGNGDGDEKSSYSGSSSYSNPGPYSSGSTGSSYTSRGYSAADSEIFFMPLAFLKLLIECWPVTLICLFMGFFLVVLTGAASHAGAFYSAMQPAEPFIYGAGAAGVIMLVVVRITGATADKRWLSILGSILIYLSATWIAFFRTGLISAWGFPAGFLGGEEYRATIYQGLAGCPGAAHVFELFTRFLEGSQRIILDDGIPGILSSYEALMRSVLYSGLPLLIAMLIYLLMIPVGVICALIPVFILPILCFLVPFIPGFLELLTVGLLLSIGL